ncbi:prohead protease/major capsid protein fusion protein [Aestuariivirga sp.]|uniref:prohead protease/major capsid protein fusion protein n=1 Tax=Aestuariivirga sp. TaxID=2650926 RepID=UPI00391900AC
MNEQHVVITRRAPLTPQSWNTEERTLEVVFSTGAPVERYDARGAYEERLSLDQDWSDFKGAPVLNSHRRGSVEDVIGSVQSAWTVGQEARAIIKLSRRADVAQIVQDILDGILRGVSVGYVVHEWKELAESARRVKIATRWQPVELSIVPIPADRLATIRGQDMTTPNPATTPKDQATPVDRAAIDNEIRSIAGLANLDRSWADEQIGNGASAEQARAAAFEAMQQRSQQTRTINSTAHNDRTLDNPEVCVRAMGEATFARTNPSHQLSGAAREFAHKSIPELAEIALRSAGISTTGLSKSSIVTRALHSTSDFPLAMADAVNRTVRQSYEAQASALTQIARMVTVRDFRPVTRISASQFSALEKVNENGEYKRGTFEESGEKISIATFGRMWAATRQLLVNDDLGIMTTAATKMGAATAALVANNLAAVWLANSGLGPQLSDGKKVWDASHGNLASGSDKAAPSDATLNAARMAMRGQRDASGQPIAIEPKVLLVPPALETAAQKLLASIYATTVNDVNPWAGTLKVMVEPRLTSSKAWYLIDPANGDLESAFLEGETGPVIESRAGWDVDGVEIKVRLDHGAAFVDWRGVYRNPGE